MDQKPPHPYTDRPISVHCRPREMVRLERGVVGPPETVVRLRDDELFISGPDRVHRIRQKRDRVQRVRPDLDLLVTVTLDHHTVIDPLLEIR